ncbi:hypothetical protein AcW2_006467 [Taiwanofungus camphoratus]|nr:hypothetical protein AcW2_006467 [Antrodia cinnamomea]
MYAFTIRYRITDGPVHSQVVMNIIATVPAATFSAIAACRAVIRLHEFTHTDVYVHSATQMVPKLRGNNAERSLRAQAAMFARPEVHVTMDHIIMEDFSPSADTHEAKGCDLEALGIGNKESPRRDYVMGMAV